MKFNKLLFTLFLAFFISRCSDSDNAGLSIPESYDGTSFSTNTSTELSVLNELATLTSKAKEGRTNGVSVELVELNSLFVGTALESVTTNFYATELTKTGGILEQISTSSGNTYTLGDINGSGGTYGAYLFNSYGLEPEQLLEKGLFGAALYNHAITAYTTSSSLTPAIVDQLVAAFGATPSFSNSDATSSNPDKFLAKYAARRDKNDGNGLYTSIRDEFIVLQAALSQGAEFNDERDEAFENIKMLWEKANAATIINYAHSGIARLNETNPTEAQIAGALHALSEAVGFLKGWRGINQSYKLITDAQIDENLVLLNSPVNTNSSLYAFATDPVNELPKLQTLISNLQTIYGFTDQEIEDFKMNWVNEQGR